MKRRGLLLAVGFGAAAAACVVACQDINNHLLEGQQYEPGGACLSAPAVIDDLPGADPGDNCAPECVTVPASPGVPESVIITTTCPPYPHYSPPEAADASRDAADPCTGAFAAYFDGAVCSSLEGGGPEAASDAARGNDAAGDAALDAALDATLDATLDGGASAPEAATDAAGQGG